MFRHTSAMFVFLSSQLLISCRENEEAVYRRLKDHADGIRIINTHEHQRLPSDFGNYRNFGFYHILAASYLAADVTSAGANAGNWKLIDSLDREKAWEYYGKALDYTRTTSYYGHLIEGFRQLYNFEDKYFTKENLEALSPAIESNYSNYEKWFDKAFRKTGYQLMFLDQHWKPFNRDIDQDHFALAFNINLLVSSAARRSGIDKAPFGLYREAGRQNYRISTFDDYLRFCDTMFMENIAKKAVCIKNAMAYSRPLYYEDVSYEEARALYESKTPEFTPAQARKIEDFMFHYIIRKAAENNLPIQIHTGYLAGNGNNLENGNPVNLNNLFLKYPEAKFVIFHGGFPWTNECAALAKMFPNVYLDLVWLPQISKEEAVRSLDVMLDCVPYNKFCWGGDSGLIEESAGSLAFAKDVVCRVLTNRIRRGDLTEKTAFEITDCIFRLNAINIYSLNNKLGLT